MRALPAVVADEFASRHDLVVLGLLPGLRERFYAISVQRQLQHPAVAALAENAHRSFPSPPAD